MIHALPYIMEYIYLLVHVMPAYSQGQGCSKGSAALLNTGSTRSAKNPLFCLNSLLMVCYFVVIL